MRGLDQIPRPFVIEPPAGTQRQFQAGERLEFRLVLIGRGIEYLPYFLFTFSELGKTGLGPGRGQYEILEVHAEGPRETKRIYNAAESKLHDAGMVVVGADLESGETPPGRLTIHFLTPTRIKSEGRMRPEINFQELIRALLRRVSSLCFFHCGRELEVDFKGLVEQAFRIKTRASDVGWQEQDRFSGRQKQRINMSGVVGTVIYEAAEPDSFAPFLPLLAAGEWVHVGKGCVMGLGKYRMEAE